MRNPAALLPAIALLAITHAPRAETALTAAQLHEHCQRYADEPRSTAGIACATYIRGFLDGAAAAGAARRTNAPPEQQQPGRVERTSSDPETRRTQSAYCVDSTVTIDRVVAEVLQYGGEYPPVGSSTAGELLDNVLRRFHACR